jgi:hypothetical protein
MSYQICDLVQLNAIQENLDTVAGNKHLAAEKTPLLDFVMSQQNVASFDIQKRISGGDGKLRDLEIYWSQALLASEVTENLTGCDATSNPCQLTKTYSFDPDANVGMDFKLSVGQLSTNPETNTRMISERVRNMMNAIKSKISQNLATSVVAGGIGAWSQDVTEVTGTNLSGGILEVNTTLANGTGAARIANPVLFEQLRTAISMANFGSTAFFGKNELAAYVRKAMVGSDSQIGYNLLAALEEWGVAAFYDKDLTAALLAAASPATNLAVSLGSIAPVGYSLYLNDGAAINSADSIASTLYDPFTGMMFEYRMTRPCDDWLIQLRARYDFYYMPTDLYKAGHNLVGVTGVAPIEVVCTDLAPCAE